MLLSKNNRVFGVLCHSWSYVEDGVFHPTTLDSMSLLVPKNATFPYISESFGFVVRIKLLNKNPQSQWKCRLIKLALLIRSGGYVVREL